MQNQRIDSIELIEISKISDPDGRGNLSVIEKGTLPYEVKRVYYLYDVPSDATRGGHAHLQLQQCLMSALCLTRQTCNLA
mgnify:CR=1 FL=1